MGRGSSESSQIEQRKPLRRSDHELTGNGLRIPKRPRRNGAPSIDITHKDYVDRYWDWEKNYPLTPDLFSAGSSWEVYWFCPDCGESRPGQIADRLNGHWGCCRDFKKTPPEKSLRSHPAWARLEPEWNEERNKKEGLTPDNCRAASNREAWWLCSKDQRHKGWPAEIKERAVRGRGHCPTCTGRWVDASNSLAGVRPDLAQLLNPYDASAPTADELWFRASDDAFWRCPKKPDHEWSEQVRRLVARVDPGAEACPFCLGLYADSENCLAATDPDLARQWHPTKNHGLEPSDILRNKCFPIWWQHPDCGHEWQERLDYRIALADPTSCKECGRRSDGFPGEPGFPSHAGLGLGRIMLWEVAPELEEEFHEANGCDFGSLSRAAVGKWLWRCKKGHVRRSYIWNRRKYGCKQCWLEACSSKTLMTETRRLVGFLSREDRIVLIDKRRTTEERRELLRARGLLTARGRMKWIVTAMQLGELNGSDFKRLEIAQADALQDLFSKIEAIKAVKDAVGVRPSISETTHKKIRKKDRGRCCKCGSQKNLQTDHFLPWCHGGASTEDNLWTLCQTCNGSSETGKADSMPNAEWLRLWRNSGRTELPKCWDSVWARFPSELPPEAF